MHPCLKVKSTKLAYFPACAFSLLTRCFWEFFPPFEGFISLLEDYCPLFTDFCSSVFSTSFVSKITCSCISNIRSPNSGFQILHLFDVHLFCTFLSTGNTQKTWVYTQYHGPFHLLCRILVTHINILQGETKIPILAKLYYSL